MSDDMGTLTDNDIKARLSSSALRIGKPTRGTSHVIVARWPLDPYQLRSLAKLVVNTCCIVVISHKDIILFQSPNIICIELKTVLPASPSFLNLCLN